MSAIQYATIKLPEDFMRQNVDPFVDDKAAGYISRADVVKTAIRDFFNKNKGGVST